MKDFLGCLGLITLFVILIFFHTIILYFLWPLVIPVVFPGLVAAGYIAIKLPFWVCFGFSLICGCLFRSINYPKK